MSKNAVVILSVLALVFAAGSGVLFYLINGKIEAANKSLASLNEFGGANAVYETRLAATGKAKAAIDQLRTEKKDLQDDVSAKTTKIAGLERNVRDKEASIQDLEGKNTQLTRERDDVQGKVAGLTSDLTSAKNKVSELETAVAKQAEDFQKKQEELEKKIASDKGELYAEVEKTRQYYTQIHNYATGRGMMLPLGLEPWSGVTKNSGPLFAPKTFVAQVLGFDARQGVVVVNVGPESGLLRDQTFDLIVGGKKVGKVSVASSPNGSVSALSFAADSRIPTLPIGTPVKLQAFSGDAPAAPAAVAAPAPAEAK